ncbi:CST complex subunit Ten1 [Microdochium bolleyi]|uniref:CST complex subunit Ten1 n=1 Tax=Microdochium bolleyi TaxID=196109 RepID=A0A136J182_9PEZI|nr:CST complex subunit Ten1 [Microdochium bolleyi]
MSTQPPPSTRCLLSELSSHEVGDKVRFLGCVAAYCTKSATLSLQHNFPHGSAHTALVDIRLLLENLGLEHVGYGSWVHVIGYITPSTVTRLTTEDECKPSSHTCIQAVLLWAAHDLNLPSYENALKPDGLTKKTSP